MPNDSVGDIVRVTIAWTYPDTQIVENNIGYQCNAAGGSDTRGPLGTAVQNMFLTNYLPFVANTATLYGYKVANVNKVPTPAPVTSVLGTSGGGGSITCPTQARPILRLITVFTGRKYRGRLFLPPPSTGNVNAGGLPGSSLVTAINALGTAIATPVSVGGSTWVPSIIHRVKGNPLATTTTGVFTTRCPALFGTQWKSGSTGRLNVNPW